MSGLASAAHLCVDMQNLLKAGSPWPAPWAERILPKVVALAETLPERTVFTRFIPPRTPDEMRGTWRDFYSKWRNVTRDHLAGNVLDLMSPLDKFIPPAKLIDKMTYSAFSNPALLQQLNAWRCPNVIISGAETDVCVLATVLHAVDFGFRVILPIDAICSSSDPCHDALLTLYRQRFSQQILALETEQLLAGDWH
ncbi:cysteine hydrolase [Dongia soli]|uniref:Cysteine hydrolase n=1 Tax=Dongia soli TaxID=600628 RepID=A0ABU5EGV3_9PROT|nr:cysteine hydrolase [Dongia soli]MDY0885659.1 cysteine hydrolase [Dongia soli]